MSFQEMKKKTKFWFKYMQVKLWCKRDYQYHCVFRYRDDISPSVERSRKDVRHCKSILKKKLFGRGKFDLDWFDVNETTDWNKNKKEIHVHILVGELPKSTRPINKPFPEFFYIITHFFKLFIHFFFSFSHNLFNHTINCIF